jgi:hypothetical protein
LVAAEAGRIKEARTQKIKRMRLIIWTKVLSHNSG